MPNFTLHRDYETRSPVDLRRCGVHVYVENPATDVWCCAYAVDDGPIELWLPGMPVPREWNECAENPDWMAVAHNDSFETTIEEGIMAPRHGWPLIPIERHRCTMAQALALSLPAGLQNAAAAVGLEQQKDMGGRDLMLRMSRPRRPRKGELPNGTYWYDDEDRKRRLYEYCKIDVSVERELDRRLLQLRPSEHALWVLDAKINKRGVHVDLDLCESALDVVNQAATWLDAEIRELTDGAVGRTTNVGQIAAWLRESGFPTTSLDKEAIDDLLVRRDLPPTVRRVLEIRREAAKAAVKKIDALLAGRNADGRARGLLQFHAAGTGRWAGRRFQPQNIARPRSEDIDGAIAAVRTGSADLVRLACGEPLAVVSDCLRGMVAAPEGRTLYAADFSNIEGRIIAWLAGEEWKLQAFRDFDAGKGHDIYKLAYARSFGADAAEIGKDDIRRQIGKVMELALGFQGGVGAFQKMAVGYGVEVPDEKADELKVAWREAHPNVVHYWSDLQTAAMWAIERRGSVQTAGRIAFRVAGSFLFMRLPSGRSIAYPYPCIRDKMTPWGEMRPQVSYKGIDTYTRQWTDCFAHGGLTFNNAVQGTARDIEAEAMTRLEAAAYPVVLSVHDEVVCETEQDFGSVSEFETIMVEQPAWAEGLPIAASAWCGARYRK